MDTSTDRNPPAVERVYWDAELLAIIVRTSFEPTETTFLTPVDAVQQAGFVVYPTNGAVVAHSHPLIERNVAGTPETLIVRSGVIEADLHGLDGTLAGTWTLTEGDILILISGGHGFRVTEDAVIVEVKQGPYLGLDDKRAL